jgi:hypothetical protein
MVAPMDSAPASDSPVPDPVESAPGAPASRRAEWSKRIRAWLSSALAAVRRPDTREARVLRGVVWVLCLAVTARVFWVLTQMAVHSIIGYDEQYFLWSGWSVTKGLAPYAEAFEYKPPMLFYTQAFALKLLGFEAMRYRWFFLFFPMASVLALQLSMMRRGAHAIATLGFALMVSAYFTDPRLHDNYLGDSESIALTYYLFGLACLLGPFRNRRFSDVVGGALMACSVLSKEPVGITVIATWVTCFFVSEDQGSFKERVTRYVRRTGIGVAAVVVVLCIAMAPNGALKGYIGLVRSYATYSDPTKSVCAVLGRFHPTTFWADLPKHWVILRKWFLNVDMLGPLLPYLVGGAVALLRRSWLTAVLAFIVVVAAFQSVTATGCYWVHYYVMALAGLFCFAALGLLAMPAASLPPAVGLWAGAILLTLSAVTVHPRYSEEASKVYHYQPLNVAPRVLAFVKRYTVPTDHIWTTGPPGIYVFANRVSATRESAILDDYLVQYPGNTDEEKLRPLREELDEHLPKVVIIDRSYAPRKRRHFAALVFPFLRAHGYQEVERDLWLLP